MATLTGTLTLSRAVIIEVCSNPNQTPQYVVSGTASAMGMSSGGSPKIDETKLDGDFRSYGGGNTRLILGSGQTRTQSFAFKALNPTQVATMRYLLGKTVCYRDTYGRRIFGAFIDMQVGDLAGSGSYAAGTLLTDVGVVIQSVTYNETV